MNDNDVKNYMKRYIEAKTNSPVNQIDIISTYPVPDAPDWRVYFLSIKVKMKIGDSYQNAIVLQTVFTKGDRITLKLMKKGRLRRDGTRRKGKNYADLLKPKVPIDAYDDAHFIAGSKNAPHKILLFTDPFCPYCRAKIVEIMNVVRNNPQTYALYYYHLPLVRIHPASDVTTRAMHVFQKRGDIKNMLKLYHLPIEASETNVDKILRAIRNVTGVTITRADINSPEVREAMRVDMAMKRRLQVTGTPTIFLDGTWDRLRQEYKKYAR
jgi:hypothetical protein